MLRADLLEGWLEELLDICTQWHVNEDSGEHQRHCDESTDKLYNTEVNRSTKYEDTENPGLIITNLDDLEIGESNEICSKQSDDSEPQLLLDVKTNGNQINNTCITNQFTHFWHLFGEEDFNISLYDIEGEVDISGLPTGPATVTRSKTWVWPRYVGFSTWGSVHKKEKLHSIRGKFLRGQLEGPMTLSYNNGVYSYIQFDHSGLVEGLCIGQFHNKIIWVSNYLSGSSVGLCCAVDWESGSLLTGLTEGNELSGVLTFIYPDLETGLMGRFSRGQMVSGQKVNLNTMNIYRGMLVVSCSTQEGPTFTYSPATCDSFGSCDPFLRDPYEDKQVTVAHSTMYGGGQGVFSKKDLEAQSIAAIFNGHKIPINNSRLSELMDMNEIYERLSYNIHMPEDEDFFLDIPPAYSDLSVYRASLGHKVNHSFKPNCQFATMFHPRWGRVRTVKTLERISQGDELFVDYGYDLIRCPDWFRDLWNQQMGDKHQHYLSYKRNK